jgi:hypothetical protein
LKGQNVYLFVWFIVQNLCLFKGVPSERGDGVTPNNRKFYYFWFKIFRILRKFLKFLKFFKKFIKKFSSPPKSLLPRNTPVFIELTRKPTQLIASFQARILLRGRAHSVDKNPKRVRPIRPFFSSYDHFTEFSAYHRILWKKFQQWISIWNFLQ